MENIHTCRTTSVDLFFRIISSGPRCNEADGNCDSPPSLALTLNTIAWASITLLTLRRYHGADFTNSNGGRIELDKEKTLCLILQFPCSPQLGFFKGQPGKSTNRALCQTQNGCPEDGVMSPNVSALLRE